MAVGPATAHRGNAGTLHVLRHTHATLALTNGVPVHVVAARLGDRPETLLRAYAHLHPQSDVEAAAQVAALNPVGTQSATAAANRTTTRRP